MMPDEWPSMRSIARWVLPVLVGPSTAVTPAPRARASRLIGDEKEIGIFIQRQVSHLSFLCSDKFLACHMRGLSCAASTPLSPQARNMEVEAAPGNEGRRFFAEDFLVAILATLRARFRPSRGSPVPQCDGE